MVLQKITEQKLKNKRYRATEKAIILAFSLMADRLSLRELIRAARISRTTLYRHHGNITQIADRLGYTSVHYFSRYFKRATGMTPSEYTLSIQAKL